jgi:hypothetical protein
MNPQNGQELTLKDIAKDLFMGTHYAHFVLKGSRHEGCDRFETLTYFQDLSNFVDLLGPVFNVTSISPHCVSFSLGIPNSYILQEYQQIYQDSKIVQIYGYDKHLWDVLDVVYKSERIYRLEDIPRCVRNAKMEEKEPYVLTRPNNGDNMGDP